MSVLYEFTRKLVDERRFSFAQFVGHGCGALRRKCRSWADDLLRRGCSQLVVLHDEDGKGEAEIRKVLACYIESQRFQNKIILIPVEEIEAWLLCDSAALKTVFNMRVEPALPRWPEAISGPKEFLGEIVSKCSNTRYVNTVHNRRIAEAVAISTMSRCPSFASYPSFVRSSFQNRSTRRIS